MADKPTPTPADPDYAAWLAGWEQPQPVKPAKPLPAWRLVLGKSRWGGKGR